MNVDRPVFTHAERQRRRVAVERLLDEHELRALVVYGCAGFPGPVHYLSEFISRQPTWLVVSNGRPPTLLLHFVNHVPTARALSTVDDVRCYWPSAGAAVAEEVIRRGAERGRIGVVGAGTAIPHGQLEALRAHLPRCEFVDITGAYNHVRWIRSGEEVERLKLSGAMIDRACDRLAAELRPGVTELDAKAVLHASFVPEGGEEGIIFISSTDMSAPDRKSPWQFPTHRLIGSGYALITEITVTYYGYGAQIHRPFAVGAAPNPLYRELFEVAEACFERVLGVLRDGASTGEVQEAARVVEDRDFMLFDSVLHGEGGKNPELGAAGSDHAFEPWTFREGQVMIIQPNPATRDGRAGLQAGCAVRVGAQSATPLHGYPLRFPVCG